MFSKLIRAILILATALTFNCNAKSVDIGDITTLAKPQNLLQSNNQPIAVIQSPALIKDNGLKARGPQTLTISLSAGAEMPIVVKGETISPGETVHLVASVDNNGVLFLPIYPANDTVGKAPFTVEITDITGAWCESGYTETPTHCEKLHVAPIFLQCESAWFLDSTQRTCTLITNAEKLPVCPIGWTFDGDANTCSYITITPAETSCPSGYILKSGSCLQYIKDVDASPKCYQAGYIYLQSENNCVKSIWLTGYCLPGYVNFDIDCVLNDWSNFVIKNLTDSSEPCPSESVDKQRLGGVWRCLSREYYKPYEYDACPTGFQNSSSGSPLCVNYSDTANVTWKCPAHSSIKMYFKSNVQSLCKEYQKQAINYSCSEGNLSGTNCVIYKEKIAGTGECPTGYIEIPNNTGSGDSDTICQKIDIQPAQIVCETGKAYSAENDRCEFLEIKQHIAL